MAWCRQTTCHYLSHCWPRSLSPCDITRPQWVNVMPHISHWFDASVSPVTMLPTCWTSWTRSRANTTARTTPPVTTATPCPIPTTSRCHILPAPWAVTTAMAVTPARCTVWRTWRRAGYWRRSSSSNEGGRRRRLAPRIHHRQRNQWRESTLRPRVSCRRDNNQGGF